MAAFLCGTAASAQDAGAPEDGSRYAHVQVLRGEADLVPCRSLPEIA
jgi:hypothetical protein